MTTKIRLLLASVLTAALALPFGSSAAAAPAATPTRAPAGGSTMVDVVSHDPATNTYVLHGLTRSFGAHVLVTQRGVRAPLAHTTSGPDGRWSVNVTPVKPVTSRTRITVEVRPTTGTRAYVLMDTLDVSSEYVPPTPATPQRSAASFKRMTMMNGWEMAWQTCQLSWKLNPVGAPAGARDVLTGVFDRVAAATGMTFTYAGDTPVIPFAAGHQIDGPGSVNVIHVAFAGPETIPAFEETVLGKGTGVGVDDRYVAAGVVLNSAELAVIDQPGITLGSVAAHEISHALGLAHVEDASQLMNPRISGTTSNLFQAGDLAGLTQVGIAAGCLPPTGE